MECDLHGNVLRLTRNPFRYLENFDEFEDLLTRPFSVRPANDNRD